MLESLGIRVLEGLTHFISLVIPQCRIRFQIAPGAGAGLGIGGVAFEILSAGAVVGSGTTDANGEVIVPLLLVRTGGCAIRIFGSEFPITMLPAWDAVTTAKGQQERFDQLGYIHGYQLDATIDPPADGNLSERFHDAINSFKWDEDIVVDGIVDPAVAQVRLTTAAGL